MSQSVKTALIAGGIIAGVLLVLSFFSGWGGGWGGWGLMGPGMMGGFSMGFMGIFWIVVVGLIIWVIVSWGRSSGGAGPDSSRGDTPLEVLKKRYARGDISKEEYEEKKKDLV